MQSFSNDRILGVGREGMRKASDHLKIMKMQYMDGRSRYTVLDRHSDAEIAFQTGGIEPFINSTLKAGTQVLRFAINRLATVSEMFLHKVRAVANI